MKRKERKGGEQYRREEEKDGEWRRNEGREDKLIPFLILGQLSPRARWTHPTKAVPALSYL